MLDKVRNVQFHSWNISSSQNHSMRLLRSWFNHLSKLIFGVGLYSSPFIIVLEDCELNSKVRIELLLPGNVTLCKCQYKSQAAADYLYEDLWIEINFSCSDAEVSNRRERKISIFNWQQKKGPFFTLSKSFLAISILLIGPPPPPFSNSKELGLFQIIT